MDETLQKIMMVYASKLCRLGVSGAASSAETLRMCLRGGIELYQSHTATSDRFYGFGETCGIPVNYTDTFAWSKSDYNRIGYGNIGVQDKNFCALDINWVRV